LYTGERNLSVDAAYATSRGILVSGTPGGPTKSSTAEHTWALVLASSRRIVSSMNGLNAGHWRGDARGEPYALPDTLEGDRMGLIGLGSIGQRVAKMARATGMEVVAWSQNLKPEDAAALGVRRFEKNELLATSKVVSLHLVLSDRTRGLIGPTELSLMRRAALLVNTSRAALVDEAALLPALESGRPAFAALDVFGAEPLPSGHAFLNHPQVMITPHLGFVSVPVYEVFYKSMVADLISWMGQEAPQTSAAVV
jgi:phosphoglycerate dehydrogenase-like enzyme